VSAASCPLLCRQRAKPPEARVSAVTDCTKINYATGRILSRFETGRPGGWCSTLRQFEGFKMEQRFRIERFPWRACPRRVRGLKRKFRRSLLSMNHEVRNNRIPPRETRLPGTHTQPHSFQSITGHLRSAVGRMYPAGPRTGSCAAGRQRGPEILSGYCIWS
jgi:hypothetical protein